MCVLTIGASDDSNPQSNAGATTAHAYIGKEATIAHQEITIS